MSGLLTVMSRIRLSGIVASDCDSTPLTRNTRMFVTTKRSMCTSSARSGRPTSSTRRATMNSHAEVEVDDEAAEQQREPTQPVAPPSRRPPSGG